MTEIDQLRARIAELELELALAQARATPATCDVVRGYVASGELAYHAAVAIVRTLARASAPRSWS